MEHRRTSGWGRKGLFAGALAVAGMALAGCDVPGPSGPLRPFFRLGWPEGVTPEAHAVGNFWEWIWVAAWTIGIIMWGLMIYSIFAFSAKRAEKAGKDPIPRQTGYNVPLELVLTTIPVIIVMTIFFFTVQTEDKVTALDKNPQVHVDVTAFQWNWKFGYREVKGDLTMDGKDYNGIDQARQKAAEGSKIDEAYIEKMKKHAEDGRVENGPVNGMSKSNVSYLHFDKIETLGTTEEVPVLVLPTHTAIEFDLASADVSHAFWVPEFLFKRDVYANPEMNHSQRLFQIKEIDRTGAFVGRCAEMCGTYHAMMNFEIRAVTPDQFKKYIEYRRENPDAPNSKALASIGEAPYATSTSPFVTGRTDTRNGNNAYTKLNQQVNS